MNKRVNNFETLKNEADFDLVFEKGKKIKLTTGCVKATYLFVDNGENKKLKIAIAIASKYGNSVWRNRFKRLIRESVRRESKRLLKIISEKKSNLQIVFSPNRINQKSKTKLNLEEIHLDVINILNMISVTCSKSN